MRHRRYRRQIVAVKKANTGKTLTKQHRKKISRGLRQHPLHAIVQATKNGITLYFKSFAECARKIECSRQLVSQCIRRPDQFKSARGWMVTLLKKEV